MKRAKQPLLLGVEDHEAHCTCRVNMMTAPVIAHRLTHAQFIRTPAGIIERRLRRIRLAIVMASHNDFLLRMRQPRNRYLHIERWQSSQPLAPPMNREKILSYLQPKARQVPRHLLRPVRRELVMPLVCRIPRLPPLEMRGDLRELIIDVERIGDREVQNTLRAKDSIGYARFGSDA